MILMIITLIAQLMKNHPFIMISDEMSFEK